MPLPVLGEQGAWREQPGGFQPGLEEPGDLSNSSRTWPLSSRSTRGSRRVAEHTVPGQRDSAAIQKERPKVDWVVKGQDTQALLRGGNRCSEGGCGKNRKGL